MKLNTIKKNMCALFMTMTVAATGYAAEEPLDELLDAVRLKNPLEINRILDERPEIINSRKACHDNQTQSPLEVALNDLSLRGVLFDFKGGKGNFTDCYIAELLIQRGADVNQENPVQGSLLCIAVSENSLDVARLLLANGADMDSTDRWGTKAYDLAKTPEMRVLFKKEELWRKRIDAVWMASDYAPPNVLNHVSEDVARWIISMLR